MRPSTVHLVHRSVNRPLVILGAERRLFFTAVVMGAGKVLDELTLLKDVTIQ